MARTSWRVQGLGCLQHNQQPYRVVDTQGNWESRRLPEPAVKWDGHLHSEMNAQKDSRGASENLVVLDKRWPDTDDVGQAVLEEETNKTISHRENRRPRSSNARTPSMTIGILRSLACSMIALAQS